MGKFRKWNLVRKHAKGVASSIEYRNLVYRVDLVVEEYTHNLISSLAKLPQETKYPHFTVVLSNQ